MTRARRLVYALVPVALLLVLGEAAARLLGAEECAPIVPQATGWETMVGDPRYLWKLEPGRTFVSPAGTTQVNRVGLRTRLLPTDPKEPDEIRVMVTGDSSVFGWGQPDGMTYAEQLEAELQRNFRGHVFHVVNLGVPGYSTVQTLRLLEDLGWRYEPDLLVVHNIFSDCNIDAFQDEAALALADPDGTLLRRMLHRSRLYCAAWMPWARFQATLNQQPNRVLMPGMPTGPNAAATLEKIDTIIDLSRVPLDDYLDNLDEMRVEAEAHGARMIVAPLAQEWDVGVWTMPMDPPRPDQVLPWHPYRQALARWADARGIDRIDLPAAFAAAEGDPRGFFTDQMHPSVRGAQIMAWAVVDHLRAHPDLLGLTPADVLPAPPRTPLAGAMRPGSPAGGPQPSGRPPAAPGVPPPGGSSALPPDASGGVTHPRGAMRIRLLVWGLAALAVTFPLALHPTDSLLGDGAIDVWNHAWGYWYVAEAIGRGTLPWRTDLVGGPEGGILYFIDTPGALAMLPVTWLAGPAMAYNLALVLRLALTGFATQLLAEEVADPDMDATARRTAGWIAGTAAITMPFLLAELRNGISEVCAAQWLILTLWATVRALRRGGLRAWLLVGLLQGVTSVVTFYYGLAGAIAVATLVLLDLAGRFRQRRPPGLGELGAMLSAGLPAAALAIPHWLIFRASLASPDALIRREPELNLRLMRHNAVDPRVFVTPGDFQSVDLAALYGEPFVHTGYLRLSVIALAGVALWRLPRSRRLGVVLAVSLVASLGPYLWWDGEPVRVGGLPLSLPFEWIRRLLPQVAITHPLRLGLAAQAAAVALAGIGAAHLLARRGWLARVVVSAAIVAEGLFGSAATWPIPRADASVPSVYAQPLSDMVLDLPAEVGTGMETSRYFWFQTVHRRPIPYTTDVRMGSARDPVTFAAFRAPPEPGRTFAGEAPRAPDPATARHIAETYGLIVVHTDLERKAGLAGAYRAALEPVFGPPEVRGALLVWRPGAATGTSGE